MTKSQRKEALKALRLQRRATIDRARTAIKFQTRHISEIKSRLKESPCTVPEIAAALKMESAQVMIFISALRKYGEVVEDAKEGDYFRYRLETNGA